MLFVAFFGMLAGGMQGGLFVKSVLVPTVQILQPLFCPANSTTTLEPTYGDSHTIP